MRRITTYLLGATAIVCVAALAPPARPADLPFKHGHARHVSEAVYRYPQCRPNQFLFWTWRHCDQDAAVNGSHTAVSVAAVRAAAPPKADPPIDPRAQVSAPATVTIHTAAVSAASNPGTISSPPSGPSDPPPSNPPPSNPPPKGCGDKDHHHGHDHNHNGGKGNDGGHSNTGPSSGDRDHGHESHDHGTKDGHAHGDKGHGPSSDGGHHGRSGRGNANCDHHSGDNGSKHSGGVGGKGGRHG